MEKKNKIEFIGFIWIYCFWMFLVEVARWCPVRVIRVDFVPFIWILLLSMLRHRTHIISFYQKKVKASNGKNPPPFRMTGWGCAEHFVVVVSIGRGIKNPRCFFRASLRVVTGDHHGVALFQHRQADKRRFGT